MKIIKKQVEKWVVKDKFDDEGNVMGQEEVLETVEVEYVAIPQPDIHIRKDEYIASLQSEKEQAQAKIAEKESELAEVELLVNKK